MELRRCACHGTDDRGGHRAGVGASRPLGQRRAVLADDRQRVPRRSPGSRRTGVLRPRPCRLVADHPLTDARATDADGIMGRWGLSRDPSYPRPEVPAECALSIVVATWFAQALYALLELLRKQPGGLPGRQSDHPSRDFKMLASQLEALDPSIDVVVRCSTSAGFARRSAYLGEVLAQMYHLATSSVCVVDGYIVPVSVLSHPPTLTIVQMWHALGAIKQFGLQSVGRPADARLGRLGDEDAPQLRHRAVRQPCVGSRVPRRSESSPRRCCRWACHESTTSSPRRRPWRTAARPSRCSACFTDPPTRGCRQDRRALRRRFARTPKGRTPM